MFDYDEKQSTMLPFLYIMLKEVFSYF